MVKRPAIRNFFGFIVLIKEVSLGFPIVDYLESGAPACHLGQLADSGFKNSTAKSWQKENQGEPLSSSPNDLGPTGKRVASYLEFPNGRPQTVIYNCSGKPLGTVTSQPPFSPMYDAKPRFPRPFRQKQIPSNHHHFSNLHL